MGDKTISEIIEGEKPFVFNCGKDSPETSLKWISSVNLIYISELHYQKSHQETEVEIIKAAGKRHKVQIAVEEFETSQQKDINYYPLIGENNGIQGFVVNGRNITESQK